MAALSSRTLAGARTLAARRGSRARTGAGVATRVGAAARVTMPGLAARGAARNGSGPATAMGSGIGTGGTASPLEAHAATSRAIATRPRSRARGLPTDECIALLTEDARTMAHAGRRLNCSDFDADEESDTHPGAGR